MARVLFLILVLLLGVQQTHAALTSARARTRARFRQQCEDGNGKACYDYGRALWSTPGVVDRKTAKKYLLRSCELGYKLACATHKDQSVTTTYAHQSTDGKGGNYGPCFKTNDLGSARLDPNHISASVVRGQRITEIKVDSFWARVGLSDGDVIYRVNTLPFNDMQEIKQAFAGGGKRFGFEIEHGGLTLTLWYSCR